MQTQINLSKIKEKKSMQELLEFGIINLDKPQGPTSFTVSEYVMKMLGLRKTSHGGTLDPAVSGVLPIFLNRACKLTGYFLGHDKEYVGVMRLHKEVDEKKLREGIKKFTGKIMQLPPVKSRVKRQIREREVYEFKILEINEKDVIFSAKVEAGTYIRKLVHDLGEKLGAGAHMLELRRIRAGIFKEEKSVSLYELEKAVDEYKKGKEEKLREIVIPAEIISEILPIIEVRKETVKRLLIGKPIFKTDLKEKLTYEKFCLFSGDKFIGVYRETNEGNIIARPEFVFN